MRNKTFILLALAYSMDNWPSIWITDDWTNIWLIILTTPTTIKYQCLVDVLCHTYYSTRAKVFKTTMEEDLLWEDKGHSSLSYSMDLNSNTVNQLFLLLLICVCILTLVNVLCQKHLFLTNNESCLLHSSHQVRQKRKPIFLPPQVSFMVVLKCLALD